MVREKHALNIDDFSHHCVGGCCRGSFAFCGCEQKVLVFSVFAFCSRRCLVAHNLLHHRAAEHRSSYNHKF